MRFASVHRRLDKLEQVAKPLRSIKIMVLPEGFNCALEYAEHMIKNASDKAEADYWAWFKQFHFIDNPDELTLLAYAVVKGME